MERITDGETKGTNAESDDDGARTVRFIFNSVGRPQPAESADIRRDSGLLAICTNVDPGEQSVAAALCTGYLQGVVEGVNFATLGDHNKLLICRPSDVTGEQMRDVVVKYLNKHPNEGHQLSVIHATEAFVQAWPCKPSAAPK